MEDLNTGNGSANDEKSKLKTSDDFVMVNHPEKHEGGSCTKEDRQQDSSCSKKNLDKKNSKDADDSDVHAQEAALPETGSQDSESTHIGRSRGDGNSKDELHTHSTSQPPEGAKHSTKPEKEIEPDTENKTSRRSSTKTDSISHASEKDFEVAMAETHVDQDPSPNVNDKVFVKSNSMDQHHKATEDKKRGSLQAVVECLPSPEAFNRAKQESIDELESPPPFSQQDRALFKKLPADLQPIVARLSGTPKSLDDNGLIKSTIESIYQNRGKPVVVYALLGVVLNSKLDDEIKSLIDEYRQKHDLPSDDDFDFSADLSKLPRRVQSICDSLIEHAETQNNFNVKKGVKQMIDALLRNPEAAYFADIVDPLMEMDISDGIRQEIRSYLDSQDFKNQFLFDKLPENLQNVVKCLENDDTARGYCREIQVVLENKSVEDLDRALKQLLKYGLDYDADKAVEAYLGSPVHQRKLAYPTLSDELKKIVDALTKQMEIRSQENKKVIEHVIDAILFHGGRAKVLDDALNKSKSLELDQPTSQLIDEYLNSPDHKRRVAIENLSPKLQNVVRAMDYLIQVHQPKQVNEEIKAHLTETADYILKHPKTTRALIAKLKHVKSLNVDTQLNNAIDNFIPPPTIFETTPLHDFVKKKYFDIPESLEHPPQKPGEHEYNVLIMGQSGVGKSTLLNAMENYLTFETADEAVKGTFKYIIPTQFYVFNKDNTRIAVTVGNEGDNERFRSDHFSGSSTQSCCVHTMTYKVSDDKTVKINFIDTPGLTDARGTDQDKKNLKNIFETLLKFTEIHTVCVVIKTNTSKLDTALKNAFDSLFSIFPKEVMSRVVFLMTHARGNFFRPGDVLTLLSSVSGDFKDRRSVELPKRDKSSIYCFDNEAFRYLCATHQNIEYTDLELKNYQTSWVKSRESALRFIDRLQSAEPLNTVISRQIQDKRKLLDQLYEQLSDAIYQPKEDETTKLLQQYKEEAAGLNSLEVDSIGFHHLTFVNQVKL